LIRPASVGAAQANAMVSAYFETVVKLTEPIPGARLWEGGAGTIARLTPLPIADVNFVYAGQDRDLGEVDAFAREMSASGLPWSLQVRGEVDLELERLADRHGKTVASTVPLLLWDAGSLAGLSAAIPAGARVRKLSGADCKTFAAAIAAGYGVPEEIPGTLYGPAVLDAPGVTAFVLELSGEAVATGLNVIADGHVGMYNGSVVPWHRGNGYYRALVTARLADAVAHGARHAFSRNTPMSRPLFEALGFRVAETWTHFTAAAE
jgi:hypothetical protein